MAESKSCKLQKIQCGHVWGGIKNSDQDIETSGLKASLFSHAHQGGKGGDIYYFSVCQGNVLTRIAIADVVGHGEGVSQVSEHVYKSMLEFMNNPDSNNMLSEWNQYVESHGVKALTTASVSGIVATNRQLHYSYAGHHPILIRKKGSKKWQQINLSDDKGLNLPLGVDKDTIYDRGDEQVHEGDKLFLYTDGLIEAADSNGKEFGVERLMEALDKNPEADCTQIKGTVLETVRHFTNDRLDHDDVTLMAIDF